MCSLISNKDILIFIIIKKSLQKKKHIFRIQIERTEDY